MKPILLFFSLVLIFGVFSFSTAEKPDLNDGKILIQFSMDGDVVSMKCLKGCSWTNADLDASENGVFYVTQDRVLNSMDELRALQSSLVDFAFSIEKNEEGLSFVAY